MLKASTLSSYAGIAADRLLKPYFLLPRLTGAVYHDFVQNAFPEPLQDVDLSIRIYLWFTHKSASPNFLLAFRRFLNKVFTEQWLGRGGPTVWPARCPDLNPLHFDP
jgi:hypothetical protein